MTSIRVKLIARGNHSHSWQRQILGLGDSVGNCRFIFDRFADSYDWLVVIDDISRQFNSKAEILSCSDEHTLLITTEPPSITNYGNAFVSQFKYVLTSQSEEYLSHPNRIYSHTGNYWFNGRTIDEILRNKVPTKEKIISTVCSAKSHSNTIHKKRLEFTRWLMQKLPELDVFGHGVKYIENKYDALEKYRYHIAVENYISKHHWTEKLADPFLRASVPIYFGCENISDYFPENSYISININKKEEALKKITETLQDPDDYSNRLNSVLEAQDLIINKYNLLKMIDNFVSLHYNEENKITARRLYGRKQMRIFHTKDFFNHIMWKLKKTLWHGN